ncbi:hypothetical protein ElyMa_004669400 [Elysia marginata]|uniref:Uncharacterized protein n=1 Tax=Elysia marginata TaxID=1093978 RepID=A0AAV4I768_9GAST|nr:hypothetical protein ElyMa_004669400 [Elysia marginata]
MPVSLSFHPVSEERPNNQAFPHIRDMFAPGPYPYIRDMFALGPFLDIREMFAPGPYPHIRDMFTPGPYTHSRDMFAPGPYPHIRDMFTPGPYPHIRDMTICLPLVRTLTLETCESQHRSILCPTSCPTTRNDIPSLGTKHSEVPRDGLHRRGPRVEAPSLKGSMGPFCCRVFMCQGKGSLYFSLNGKFANNMKKCAPEIHA